MEKLKEILWNSKEMREDALDSVTFVGKLSLCRYVFSEKLSEYFRLL